ncbi:MAG: anaerobic ribonucleoside-triphosphate reductase activating protein [Lachnospiraceae bacterium]|nr:anaerobic ribonucleoside-triphosphate reductase activating protein [Lachnospiraceae bacterium]
MNYANIKKTDVANGPGIRVSLFVSGCTHRCRGCFNSEAWDFRYGREYTRETEEEILRALAPDYIRGLSVLGGEPMEPENRGTVLTLLKAVRRQYPQKDIWCYTGYDYEKDLLVWAGEGSYGGTESPAEGVTETVDGVTDRDEAASDCAADRTVRELLDCIDVLVDGEFMEERKNLRLAFRGSENQRLIDVKKSLQAGRTVCLPE